MRKRIKAYRRRIDALLKEMPDDADWNGILKEHLTQITFFQHERLVHLIVTMTFALLTLIALGIALLTGIITMFLLTGALALLLIPYILHYFLLENEVQAMYGQYDDLLKLNKNYIFS